MQITFVNYSAVFLEKSWNWMNDSEIKFLTDTPAFSKENQLKWFESLPDRTDYKIWGIADYDLPVGVFGLKNITGEAAEYWGYIGQKEYWDRGIGKMIIKKAIEIATEMELRFLYLKVIKENKRAIGLYEKMGFICEGEEGKRWLMRLNLNRL